MRSLLLVAALALSACAGRTPPPAIEVRTEHVEVPVPVRCIKVADVPVVPARIGNKLTGNAVEDANLLAAANLRLRSALDQALALISGCSIR
jgi:hypothetical protein